MLLDQVVQASASLASGTANAAAGEPRYGGALFFFYSKVRRAASALTIVSICVWFMHVTATPRSWPPWCASCAATTRFSRPRST